ncbi:hypothetical protein Psesu_0223 [Pseudoxanthomonas suwonensis 11-1]|uniref:DUF4124 domain-containing protein n=1 Tax=Pseudoxanthomonas suwonensis (strain 11-1) TaxID=743721 RepID=E6WPB2_PSEUU|nr:hypothetical protein [Pseudoxanthomonas suwonensis]ADV26085.1 hypothetical protein Psesu_0223 [Pseudoxanthomonas suwonensis 11-1]
MRPGLTRDIRPDAFARALAVLLLATALPEASASGPVTIYRCTASDGTVSVGNTPCAGGQRQEQRQMQRPQDPAPGTVREVRSTAEPAAPATAPPHEVRVVRVEPPQPMYACTTPDGERYLSDDDQGSARWAPLWVAGYAPARPHPPQGPRPGPRPPQAGGPRPSPPPGPGPAPGHRLPHGPVLVPTGTWVQDACERLPQEEVCRHLSDRRYEILRIYHGAMPSEREALDAEQAGIDARLARDCS